MWRTTALADSYRVQLSTARAFTSIVTDTAVADTTFQLAKLAANSRFYWRVSAFNAFGASEFSSTAWFETGVQSRVEDEAALAPCRFELLQNYPNPFNPATTIRFSLAAGGHVELKVHDLLGREMASLLSRTMAAGEHSIHFDASALKSGTYLYTLRTEGFTSARIMVLLK
ncbi:MAG TPA: T9SS type A sorting domain-containing protein [bacterium]|nr:T9SS type A sorting domain-containing protein [bacterium]